ncbi:MAG: carboxylesterase/lipase family protein [Clostridia bacterium]|nr:carboxylesterase/lipase family protein [Clostridia bacterium]
MSEHIVKTSCGQVRGIEQNGQIHYLGIPYAEPPVGNLRFKRAIPKTPWEGILDAKAYGPVPVQFDKGVMQGSEDCLTVNIKRPATDEVLPVFVWIYGGGYNTGSASDGMYRGDAFARDGVVFVSFQYRLNILGFYDFTTYPGCSEFDSNCGLSDQILALNWIHDNIAAFGGDPDRITIAGESAGGASVVNMLAAPGVKGCFQQAIAQSGLPNCVMTHQTARQNIDLFLEGMGWSESEMAEHLLHDDPFTFLKGNDYVAQQHQYKNPGMFLPGPVQDDLLPVRPIDAIRGGSAAGVKLIIGTNMHEGTMFVHPENTGFPNSWAMIAEMFEKNHHADAIPDVVGFYHPSARDSFVLFEGDGDGHQGKFGVARGDHRQIGGDPFIRFATDYAFEMPAIKVALAQRQYTKDVWMYRYELITRSGAATGWKATHAAELPAVFEAPKDHEFTKFIYDGEPDSLYAEMVSQMHGDWVRFITTGSPNPDWDRFESADSSVRIYDRETRTERLDRRHLMQIWGDMRFYEL